MTRINEIRGMGRPADTSSGILKPSHDIVDETTSYRAIRFNTGAIGTTAFVTIRTFDVYGDHLFIDKVFGPFPIYIRLGRSNPFIRVREGMTLKRNFARVTVMVPDTGETAVLGSGSTIQYAELLAFASTGELVECPDKQYGAKIPYMQRGLTATTAFQALQSFPGFASDYLTFGVDGGFVEVTNTDLANNLILAYGPVVVGTSVGRVVYPGQSVTIKVEHRSEFQIGNSAARNIGWGVFTDAGTCSFGFMVSSCEIDEAQSTQRVGPPLGVLG